MGHHDANEAAQLAFDTEAVGRDVGAAAMEQRADHFQELVFVDGAAAQFEVDRYVFGNRGGSREGIDDLGLGIDAAGQFAEVSAVAQGLNAAGGGTGAHGHQGLGDPADFLNASGVMGCGDGAFHQRNLIAALGHVARGFREIGDLHQSGDGQQIILTIQQAKLAAVAGGELPDGQFWFA